jgi:hypothetical protein
MQRTTYKSGGFDTETNLYVDPSVYVDFSWSICFGSSSVTLFVVTSTYRCDERLKN